ncbi:hypothetical protein Tco_0890457 [Tanacetum coccineum]|uniref:Uncharacterized protein n=1 Tax=Tanacetum coccineum TaxID=301880 RepID=A0ABQ5C046_9ASTR
MNSLVSALRIEADFDHCLRDDRGFLMIVVRVRDVRGYESMGMVGVYHIAHRKMRSVEMRKSSRLARDRSKLEYKFQDKENSEDIFSYRSALEDFICVVFVHDRNIAQIRRIFLDGYGVLVFRIVFFKISSFKLQNTRLLLRNGRGFEVFWESNDGGNSSLGCKENCWWCREERMRVG